MYSLSQTFPNLFSQGSVFDISQLILSFTRFEGGENHIYLLISEVMDMFITLIVFIHSSLYVQKLNILNQIYTLNCIF